MRRIGERLGENDNWIAGFCRYYREPIISSDSAFDSGAASSPAALLSDVPTRSGVRTLHNGGPVRGRCSDVNFRAPPSKCMLLQYNRKLIPYKVPAQVVPCNMLHFVC